MKRATQKALLACVERIIATQGAAKIAAEELAALRARRVLGRVDLSKVRR